MATKVSISTSSASSGASRTGETSAARNGAGSAGGTDAAGGFSSAMSAATRPQDCDGSNRGGGYNASARSASSAQSGAKTGAGSTTGTKTASGAKAGANGSSAADNSSQDTNAATAAAQTDASLIDSQLAQNGKTDKSSSKSRTASGDASAAIPGNAAALALMLASSGMQIDGRNAAGQQHDSDDSQDSSSAGAGDAAQAIAAGALAGMVAGLQPSAATPVGAASTAVTAATTSTSTATAQGEAAALIALESTSSDNLNDADVLDSGSAPARSGGATAAQTAPSAGPAVLPDMIRSLAAGGAQASSVERAITTTVSDRNWSGAVAGQIQWMVNSNVQNATLQLSPEHLGPLEIHVDVQSSQVNVTFSASHADTRAALEQSVPRLREIRAAGGLTLGQTSVQQESRSASGYQPSVSRGAISAAQSVDPVSVSSVRALGLIDEYA